jgi:hypothetical protein
MLIDVILCAKVDVTEDVLCTAAMKLWPSSIASSLQRQ